MDTKTFYDRLMDAGINLRNEDCADGVNVALELVLGGDDYFTELHIDWIAEAFCGRDRSGEDKSLTERFQLHLCRAYSDGEFLTTRREQSNMTTTFAGSFMFHITNMGEAVYNIIRPRAEKYVDDNIEEWWLDAQSYAADMEEGQREDWAYENWRDRQMERD